LTQSQNVQKKIFKTIWVVIGRWFEIYFHETYVCTMHYTASQLENISWWGKNIWRGDKGAFRGGAKIY